MYLHILGYGTGSRVKTLWIVRKDVSQGETVGQRGCE